MYPKLIVLLGGLLIQGSVVAGEKDVPQTVGRSVCASCHADQVALWSGSHHDLAMQPANSQTVLGDFDNVSVTHYGVTSTFFRKDGSYRVRTEGPDGKLQDYAIKYTFGVEPLQQYLIKFPGGRLQALSLAWDARPEEIGGQRWFHLYPDEKIAHDDELHWTRSAQNWNSMCAECHSTRLASTSGANNARYIYVYAVALYSTGEPEKAILVLQGAHNQYPNNRDILSALVAFHRDGGNQQAASSYAEKLRALSQ
jgi:cytochrome c553